MLLASAACRAATVRIEPLPEGVQVPDVQVSVGDPDDPFNVVVVRGIVEATEEGADAHIDALAKKYMGLDSYPMRRPGEVRVIYTVKADKVVMQSADD